MKWKAVAAIVVTCAFVLVVLWMFRYSVIAMHDYDFIVLDRWTGKIYISCIACTEDKRVALSAFDMIEVHSQ